MHFFKKNISLNMIIILQSVKVKIIDKFEIWFEITKIGT